MCVDVAPGGDVWPIVFIAFLVILRVFFWGGGGWENCWCLLRREKFHLDIFRISKSFIERFRRSRELNVNYYGVQELLNTFIRDLASQG